MQSDDHETRSDNDVPPRTRTEFLGAAAAAGGAVFLTPAAAAAKEAAMAAPLSPTVPIAKIVNVRSVPETLTPRDLASIAGLSSAAAVAKEYPDLRLSQLRSIIDATIKDYGGDMRVFGTTSGGAAALIVACCCCCCCKNAHTKL